MILSGLSIGIWAAIRGLEPKKMLGSTTVFMERVEPAVEEAESTIIVEERVIRKYGLSLAALFHILSLAPSQI